MLGTLWSVVASKTTSSWVRLLHLALGCGVMAHDSLLS